MPSCRCRVLRRQSVLRQYAMEKTPPNGWEYTLTMSYRTDEELDRIIYDTILREADSLADMRYCFIEADVRALDGSDRSWGKLSLARSL